MSAIKVSEASRVNRRRFLKYVAAGAVAVGGGAAAYHLYKTAIGQEPEVSIPTTMQTNRPPVVSEIKIKPAYINPTTEYLVQFSHDSYDPDGDPLITTWLIDGKEVSHERNYSARLAEGHRWIVLKVSDSNSEVTKYGSLTVDPDQTYPTRPLYLRHKGICYCAGPVAPDWPTLPNPSRDQMDEQLDTIRNELGCNAIVIFAGRDYEDQLIECGRLAIEKGFDRIYIGPEYMGASPEETVERLEGLAPRIRDLRETSEAIVFLVGHEFGLETAIVRGNDWVERLENMKKGIDWDKVTQILPVMFSKIIQVCDKNYGYQIAYRAIATEADLVPWSDPVFESVGVDAYIQEGIGWTETWILDLLSRLKMYRKPVCSIEAGCFAIKGAGQIAGQAPLSQNPLDEDEQANYIDRYCKMLNRAGIDGYFYTVYNENWDKGYGLYNGKKRKKGFYMYKSYQRVS